MGPIGAGAADQREFEITLGRRRMAALELGGQRWWYITPSDALHCVRDRTQTIVAEKLRSNPLEPGWRANIAVLPLVAVRAAASVAPAWRVVGSRTLGRRAGAFYLSSKPRGREKERKMRAISLAEANKIINGTFASAKRRKAHALAAIMLDASHLPWEGPTLTPALAGADFP